MHNFKYSGKILNKSDSLAVEYAKVFFVNTGDLIFEMDSGRRDSGYTDLNGNYIIENNFFAAVGDDMRPIREVDSFPIKIIHQQFDTIDTVIYGNQMIFKQEDEFINISVPNIYLKKH